MLKMFSSATPRYTDTNGQLKVPVTKAGYVLVNFTCLNRDQDGSIWNLSYDYEICITSKFTTEWIDCSLPQESNDGDFESCIIKIEEDLNKFSEITAIVRAKIAPEESMEALNQKYTFEAFVI